MRAGEVSEEDGSAIMNVEEVNPVPLADFGNLVDVTMSLVAGGLRLSGPGVVRCCGKNSFIHSLARSDAVPGRSAELGSLRSQHVVPTA